MEPQRSGNTISNFSPENQIDSQVNFERLPETPTSPEAPIESAERPASAEQLGVDRAGQSIQPTVAQPAQDQTQQDDTQQDVSVVKSTPQVAGDSDAIEKEWVDKVKQVISQTRNDPHAQQSEVSRLMADYVLKRFGRKIGEPEE